MEIAINEAKAKLSALINAATRGEQVLLTKHGRPVAEIKPFAATKTPIEKLTALRRIAKRASERCTQGPSAAHSADFLYDDTGMPS